MCRLLGSVHAPKSRCIVHPPASMRRSVGVYAGRPVAGSLALVKKRSTSSLYRSRFASPSAVSAFSLNPPAGCAGAGTVIWYSGLNPCRAMTSRMISKMASRHSSGVSTPVMCRKPYAR